MKEGIKLGIHWCVSHLLIVAPPLVNGLLSLVDMHLTVGQQSADDISSSLLTGAGLVYAYWTHRQTKAATPTTTTPASK